jgi:hypothetical protein
MIRHNHNPDQLKVNTSIKIIDKDGTETVAPVVVIVGITKVKDKQQYNIYKIVNYIFNRDFVIDKRIKATSPKKKWWKFW